MELAVFDHLERMTPAPGDGGEGVGGAPAA
jgi:hypothetical protein